MTHGGVSFLPFLCVRVDCPGNLPIHTCNTSAPVKSDSKIAVYRCKHIKGIYTQYVDRYRYVSSLDIVGTE